MSKSEALTKLRHTIDVIEASNWIETNRHWGNRAEWEVENLLRDEVLRDLKAVYHTIGGPKL